MARTKHENSEAATTTPDAPSAGVLAPAVEGAEGTPAEPDGEPSTP